MTHNVRFMDLRYYFKIDPWNKKRMKGPKSMGGHVLARLVYLTPMLSLLQAKRDSSQCYDKLVVGISLLAQIIIIINSFFKKIITIN